jgi:hypothetical protein
MPSPAAYQPDQLDHHQNSEPFDQQADENGDDGGIVTVDYRQAEPSLHTGSRPWNGLPSGTTFGQLALMPASAVSRMPSVTVWQLYRSQFIWYETRSKVTVLPAPARRPIEDGGHADHGHDQHQLHPDPA